MSNVSEGIQGMLGRKSCIHAASIFQAARRWPLTSIDSGPGPMTVEAGKSSPRRAGLNRSQMFAMRSPAALGAVTIAPGSAGKTAAKTALVPPLPITTVEGPASSRNLSPSRYENEDSDQTSEASQVHSTGGQFSVQSIAAG